MSSSPSWSTVNPPLSRRHDHWLEWKATMWRLVAEACINQEDEENEDKNFKLTICVCICIMFFHHGRSSLTISYTNSTGRFKQYIYRCTLYLQYVKPVLYTTPLPLPLIIFFFFLITSLLRRLGDDIIRGKILVCNIISVRHTLARTSTKITWIYICIYIQINSPIFIYKLIYPFNIIKINYMYRRLFFINTLRVLFFYFNNETVIYLFMSI